MASTLAVCLKLHAVPPLKLTPSLCRLVARPVDDPGPEVDLPYFTASEYSEAVDQALGWFGDRVHVFGYGSLIWRPPVAFEECRPALLRGWHRSFCLKTTRWRGTGSHPGLMMALEPGGLCEGMVMTLPRGAEAEGLDAIWRREIGVKPVNHDARLVRLETESGPVEALTFTANPEGRSYCGNPGFGETVRVLASAAGVWDSCADYLRETVDALDKVGLLDAHLWSLQEAVAEAIQANSASGLGPAHS